nr:bifunctional folylpolyglutamate synthase/dihydrofolate synthase [Oceanococcus sp. HetDA_MAG_MS8]
MPDLASWLAYQQDLHNAEIDLGLERVRSVFAALGLRLPSQIVIVAGTNGKGSCVHALDALAQAAGKRTLRYTSPHLYRYNERICVDGAPVSDESLCTAFAAIEAARGQTPLTFFEFGTLAALYIAAQLRPDVVLLEVGLGGRLDATNIVDADAAILCSLGLDHQEWLGHSLDLIAKEKAGVCRRARPVVVADPQTWEYYAPSIHAIQAGPVWLAGRDYALRSEGDLPHLSLGAAVCAADVLGWRLSSAQVEDVFSRLSIPGRMEIRSRDYGELVLDVAHNLEAVQRLLERLRHRPDMPTWVICGVQADKDVAAMLPALTAQAEQVFLTDLPAPRGSLAEDLRLHCAEGVPVRCFAHPQQALSAAESAAHAHPQPLRIIMCGSFVTLGMSGLG